MILTGTEDLIWFRRLRSGCLQHFSLTLAARIDSKKLYAVPSFLLCVLCGRFFYYLLALTEGTEWYEQLKLAARQTGAARDIGASGYLKS